MIHSASYSVDFTQRVQKLGTSLPRNFQKHPRNETVIEPKQLGTTEVQKWIQIFSIDTVGVWMSTQPAGEKFDVFVFVHHAVERQRCDNGIAINPSK